VRRDNGAAEHSIIAAQADGRAHDFARYRAVLLLRPWEHPEQARPARRVEVVAHSRDLALLISTTLNRWISTILPVAGIS
jgi:hypothetical protein